jgi:hypothetical protein
MRKEFDSIVDPYLSWNKSHGVKQANVVLVGRFRRVPKTKVLYNHLRLEFRLIRPERASPFIE